MSVDWTLDWFLRRDIVEINVKRSRTVPDADRQTPDDQLVIG